MSGRLQAHAGDWGGLQQGPLWVLLALGCSSLWGERGWLVPLLIGTAARGPSLPFHAPSATWPLNCPAKDRGARPISLWSLRGEG